MGQYTIHLLDLHCYLGQLQLQLKPKKTQRHSTSTKTKKKYLSRETDFPPAFTCIRGTSYYS